MFIRPKSEAEVDDFVPDFTIINACKVTNPDYKVGTGPFMLSPKRMRCRQIGYNMKQALLFSFFFGAAPRLSCPCVSLSTAPAASGIQRKGVTHLFSARDSRTQADGLNSDVFVAFNVEKNVGIIGGTWYGGEMKKGIFGMMNYWLPMQGIMPMHCSANVGKNGDRCALWHKQCWCCLLAGVIFCGELFSGQVGPRWTVSGPLAGA
jgi:hypothetical protein